MTQIQALFSPTILELHVRKKLKAHASSTKSQQNIKQNWRYSSN